MQDNLFKYSRIPEKAREHFGLVRGDTQQERKDRLKRVRADEERVRKQAEDNEEAVKVIKDFYDQNYPGMLRDTDFKTPSELAEFFVKRSDEVFLEKFGEYEKMKENLTDLAQKAYEKGYRDGHAQREKEDRAQLLKNIGEGLDKRYSKSSKDQSRAKGHSSGYEFY